MDRQAFTYSLLITAILFLSGCADEEAEFSFEEAGQEVVRLLQAEEFETIYESWFTEEFQQSLSVEELTEKWIEKTEDGEFLELRPMKAESRTENLDVVEITLVYTTIEFDVRMIFNEEQLLEGLNFSDGVANLQMPDSIVEEQIVVGEGTEYELDGLLTLPKDNDGNLPAVILVHGSGPGDRDQAAYAYKPFRDIAWKLAENGIAVIRYDKRTFVYGNDSAEDPSKFTVYEEVVEDAIRATELTKSDPRIDEDRVFLAGLSLGGMLAPRIETQGGDYAGLIILAGTPRPLWEVIYDQLLASVDIVGMEGEEKEEFLQEVEAEYEKAQNLRNLTDEEAQGMVVFGLGGYYLKEMDEYDVPTTVTQIDKPMLILQGEDDFQVYADKDFVLWQELLEDDEDVTFMLYPGLNHFFIAYEGPDKGTVKEYETPSLVDEQVIEDMSRWILEQ